MELIITEKPSSAKKIAEALADTKPKQNKKGKVSYYEITHEGKPITIVSAVGHLYTVAEEDKKGWTYPVFGVHWVPSGEVNKDAAFTKKYLSVIKQLAKKAKSFTIATDYDIEGEVIGYNILRFACGQEDGNRMKYSTVTKKDLIESYNSKEDHLMWGQAFAGVTRHELDWYYGINLSRALTLSVKAVGSFKLLSAGRVQGPALKIIVDREREIKAFVPELFWQLEMHTPELMAMHEKDKFWKEAEVKKANSNVTKEAEVDKISKRQFKQAPPNPFDLTSLQTEAHRSFGMNPKETLQHAQDLYSKGYTSYPRTSSQQLPPEIGYKDILHKLTHQHYYKDYAHELLHKHDLKPNNGKKTDPAHPAIYPTGEIPHGMHERSAKVYDLIVRRFLATFSEAAERETVTLRLVSGAEGFTAKGTRTTYSGWHKFYGPHVKVEEREMPNLHEGQKLPVEKTEILAKETQPPKRYSPASIIKELEKRGLGTKATRADIVENLFKRGYVYEKSIEAAEIGMHTVSTLEKYVPEILDEHLTREIEEKLEKIRHDEVKPEKVLGDAREHLKELLANFKKHEKEIGEELLKAHRDSQDARTMLGPSPNPEEGSFQIKRSKFGYFVGSTKYPECTSTFSLPSNAEVTPGHKKCPWCSFPLVNVKRKRSGKRLFCFNKNCSSRELSEEGKKRAAEIETGNFPCPTEPEIPLIVKDSMTYGKFICCQNYPKRRYTESLETVWDVNPEMIKDAEDLDVKAEKQ